MPLLVLVVFRPVVRGCLVVGEHAINDLRNLMLVLYNQGIELQKRNDWQSKIRSDKKKNKAVLLVHLFVEKQM